MSVKDWSESAASNTTVGGINIAEGMARADVNNSLRAVMAEGKTAFMESPSVKLVGGATGDGTTNDLTAIQAAVDSMTTGGTLRFPGAGTYYIASTLTIGVSNLVIDLRGATLKSDMTSLAGMVSVTGSNVTIKNGKIQLTGASDNPWEVNVTGENVTLDRVHLDKTPNAGHYHLYVRSGATGFTMRNSRTSGSNGIYVEANDFAFINNRFIGRSVGGDDAIALKSISQWVRGGLIQGNSFENLAYMCSIGSEIGVNQANDTSYTRGVSDIQIIGNRGKSVSGILYVKPGAIGAYDYRDGTVEDIICSNNEVYDATGSKFANGITLAPSRGARIRRITGKNNVINARAISGSGRKVGTVDCYLPDYRSTIHFNSGGTYTVAVGNTITGATSGATGVVATVTLTSGTWAGGDAAGYLEVTSKTGAFQAENLNVGANTNVATVFGDQSAPSVSDIDLQVEFNDIYNGAAYHATNSPGYPVTYGCAVERQTAAYGTLARLNFDIKVNGSAEAGALVHTSADDAVTFRNLQLRNVNQTGGTSQGGAYLLSRVQIDEASISQASGNAYNLGTTGAIVSKFDQMKWIEQVNAGNSDQQAPWFAPRRCYITKIEVTTNLAITQSDTNYSTFSMSNASTSFHTPTTKATAGTASAPSLNITANALVTMLDSKSVTDATNQANCFFAKDARLYIDKTETGTGATVRNARLRIHWAPY